MVSTENFRAGMRRLAAGVSIISTQGEQGPEGITATAVTSLSAEPPSVIACVNKTLRLGSSIQRTKTFGISILRNNHSDLARTFAGMDGVRGNDKFSVGTWQELPGGVPVLADSLVSISCELNELISSGTHLILIGQITDIILGDVGEPLVYCDGEFTGLRRLAVASAR